MDVNAIDGKKQSKTLEELLPYKKRQKITKMDWENYKDYKSIIEIIVWRVE